jgi:excisionase family DNA binding protein
MKEKPAPTITKEAMEAILAALAEETPRQAAIRPRIPKDALWPTKPAPEARVYTLPEVAYVLRVGRNKIYELINNGELPVIKLGKRYMVPKAALDRLLDSAELVQKK